MADLDTTEIDDLDEGAETTEEAKPEPAGPPPIDQFDDDDEDEGWDHVPKPPPDEDEEDEDDPKAEETGEKEPETAEKPPESAEKLKVTVGKEEREYTPAELSEALEKADGADQKFREASEIRKEAFAFYDALRKNPMAVIERVAQRELKDRSKARAWLVEQAIAIVSEHAEEESLSDDARRARALERELEELRGERRRQEEEATRTKREKEAEAKRHQAIEVRDAVFAAEKVALESSLGRRVDDRLALLFVRGEDISDEVVRHVLREEASDLEKSLASLTPEEAEAKLPDLVKAIRERDIARLKSERSAKGGGSVPGTARKPSPGRGPDRRGRTPAEPQYVRSSAELPLRGRR